MGLYGTVKQWAFKGDPRFANVIPDEAKPRSGIQKAAVFQLVGRIVLA